jgi:UDPglucose 6-dehydrogenase
MFPTLAYAGMSHLGLNSAAAAAEKGFNVLCFDQDTRLIQQLKLGNLPIAEEGLADAISKNSDRIQFSSQATDLGTRDLIYISLDIATDHSGLSDLSELQILLDHIAPHIRNDAVQVILSQVPPGFTRRQNSENCILYYQVETLIFGEALNRALYPERIIIGCPGSESPLPDALRKFIDSFNCPILPMQYENAELTKIAINCCLVASVSTANTLSELCENIGADWGEILPALRLDKRIGEHAYLKPGLGISGGNLERDLATVTELAKEYGTDSGVVESWVSNSHHRKRAIIDLVNSRILPHNPKPKLAIWGLAYKENTHSTKNSAAIVTIEALLQCQISVHDPAVSSISLNHSQLTQVSYPLDALPDADALIIMTPWKEYRDISLSNISNILKGKILIDPFRIMDPAEVKSEGLEYYTLGMAKN